MDQFFQVGEAFDHNLKLKYAVLVAGCPGLCLRNIDIRFGDRFADPGQQAGSVFADHPDLGPLED